MFTFLGIVLLLAGLAMLIIRPFINAEDKYKTKTDMRGQETRVLVGKKSHPFLLSITKKLAFIVLFVGFLFVAVPGIFFYAQPGMLYAVQYPTGGSKAVTQQGIKLKWWGKLIPIQMEIPIQDVLPDNETDHSPYAYIEKAQLREFNDAVKGTVANSIVVTVDYVAIDEKTGKERFLDVALKNRSQDNLVYSRIIPYRNAVLKNTAKLMSAQEYIAGGSAEFDRAYKDQLEFGMYILEEVIDQTPGDTIGQLHTTRIVGADEDGQIKKYKIRYDQTTKEPLRNEGALHEYGLTVQQAVVDKIDWEDNFDTRLDAQKAEVAATQLERQKAQKATEMKKRIIEEGESNKAEERAKLEKEQIQRTIAAETEVKENEFFLQAEKVKFEKSKIEVQARKILADVKKYEIEQADGLSEKERYIIDKNVEKGIGVAKEVKDTKFPQFMYFGGGAGTGTASNTPMIYDLLGAKLAESMFGPVTTEKK